MTTSLQLVSQLLRVVTVLVLLAHPSFIATWSTVTRITEEEFSSDNDSLCKSTVPRLQNFFFFFSIILNKLMQL